MSTENVFEKFKEERKDDIEKVFNWSKAFKSIDEMLISLLNHEINIGIDKMEVEIENV